uniref:Uncharacterized protein n=1 Tax=Rhizophora mucronata TaxID=61149 RepID=A0A2P2IYZ5_RHIMU
MDLVPNGCFHLGLRVKHWQLDGLRTGLSDSTKHIWMHFLVSLIIQRMLI